MKNIIVGSIGATVGATVGGFLVFNQMIKNENIREEVAERAAAWLTKVIFQESPSTRTSDYLKQQRLARRAEQA